MSPRREPEEAEPRWLTADQLVAWRGVMKLFHRLPDALEVQLQGDAQLSFIEYYVLAGLSDQPEGRMRMSELAVLVNAELSRLSHMISRLEKRGLVGREPDPSNRRYTRAVLTDAGFAYLKHDELRAATPTGSPAPGKKAASRLTAALGGRPPPRPGAWSGRDGHRRTGRKAELPPDRCHQVTSTGGPFTSSDL
ncbi:MarR family transcriptional regulator [Streptomyces sp. NPDC088124]|uniref:MarR family winged helix-turn-helix transcriptional regulator n=1 Tax=Streptomyces sp. NPDC088124 TaxID=3154654 RepID=UPI0034281422